MTPGDALVIVTVEAGWMRMTLPTSLDRNVALVDVNAFVPVVIAPSYMNWLGPRVSPFAPMVLTLTGSADHWTADELEAAGTKPGPGVPENGVAVSCSRVPAVLAQVAK